MNTNCEGRLLGCLLGTAVGDAIGLPAEGLSAARQRRLFGPIDRHRLVFGRGMVSDDTEHALLTMQALTVSGGDPERFGRDLARRLRWWFLALPPGVGLATARACLRLCVGFGPESSGVASAGNGPAMRAAAIGAFCADDPDPGRLRALVRVAARITHTDPRAEAGALRVALWAAGRETPAPDPDDPGGEVSGFVVRTVAAAAGAIAAHPDDLRAAVRTAVARGGDTDTVAAVVGGVLGARLGAAAVPSDWLSGLLEPGWNPARMARLARECAASAGGAPGSAVGVAWPLRVLRNLFLLAVVLAHGFRRLAPPYG